MDNNNLYQNPIDVVEDIIHTKKWSFSRADDHELVAEISSNLSHYRLYFSWSEQFKAINFVVTFDLKFPSSKSRAINELLAKINEKLWIGHFDITSKNGIPAFRHTLFESSESQMLHIQLEKLVNIAVYECEKYCPAFQLVLFEDSSPQEALKLCAIDTIGNA